MVHLATVESDGLKRTNKTNQKATAIVQVRVDGIQTTGKQQNCRKVHGVEMRGLAVDRVSRGKKEKELRTRMPTF